MPEIELGKIAIKMGFAHGVKRAHHPALEERKIGLDRVGVPEGAANVPPGLVVDLAVTGVLPPTFG